ncbi:MAG TPA: NAD(P)/FAD-dependent oxidoreductase [Actinomycetes bacterium]|jgi:phytoene dehydrogenase-like protein|nr:NAD(P)/FAD-dependent oxidoreductase [Actinomycetes bacterium]
MADYDAIVCGGGSNGLAAAIRLAEAGWSVCLLEANHDLGGAARTLESTLPGFKHDFGAAFFPLVAPSPSIIGRDLAPYGLRFVHAQLPAAHPFPGNQAIALGRSAVETAASIDKVHLGDGAVWFGLDEAFGEVMKPFLRAQMQRWPFEELARVVGRLRLAGGLEFARMVVQGVSAIADRFESEQAKAFITGPAMHADLQPEMPGTGIYALLLSMLGQRFGMPVAEGGTGMITAALVAKARQDGVEIATGRRVGRIVVEGGRAVAVEAGGEPVSARRAVICALDVGALVRLAGPESFPPRALAEVRSYRPGLGTFKVDWALDGQVPWAADECRRAAVVHVGNTVLEMSRSAWEASHGLLPAKPTLILGQQSLADPSRAPAGKHTLWGYAHVPAEPTGDAGRPRARAGWDRSTESFLDRVEQGIEAHAPGFRDRVLARKAWTPADLEAADATLAGGDIQAGSFSVDQQILFRPGPSWWRWGTPVKGLYLGGASVPPGAGVHGACGDLAARQALADHDRPRMLAMATAGAGLATAALVAATRARGGRR